jgi:hypothetical protein
MKANAVSIVNKLTTRRMLSGSFRALNNDVKIFAKLPSCNRAASGETPPDVHGKSRSPGRSRSSSGTNMIRTAVSDREKR